MESLEEKIENCLLSELYATKYIGGIEEAYKQCTEIAEQFAVGFAEYIISGKFIKYNTGIKDCQFNILQEDISKMIDIYKQHLKENGK